ncbi:hypothetical protein FHR24_001262 [Wenyingzhuangia heitensis]|uniref:Carbohydrate binding domain-containing protein n=1 Tax=Wenyingzhuangia heitensis TaxID=1487859 RepID=A0ABX0U9D1_9FLAO|nr:hypothetical protein [Wenyingzhuangia heitensis]NIJ44823.1 hypothetical protein [Wenyingzhuangia heitensis]
MIQKLFKNTCVAFTVLGISFAASAQISGVDKASFDFENGSPENWTQSKGFETSTEQVASGKKSMKVTFKSYDNIGAGPKLQSFRGKKVSPGFFNLKAGTYEVSAKVFLEGEVPGFLQISLSGDPKVNSKFKRLDKLPQKSWQTLTSTFTIDKDSHKNWLSIGFFVFPKSGSGTVYVDDLNIVKK